MTSAAGAYLILLNGSTNYRFAIVTIIFQFGKILQIMAIWPQGPCNQPVAKLTKGAPVLVNYDYVDILTTNF